MRSTAGVDAAHSGEEKVCYIKLLRKRQPLSSGRRWWRGAVQKDTFFRGQPLNLAWVIAGGAIRPYVRTSGAARNANPLDSIST